MSLNVSTRFTSLVELNGTQHTVRVSEELKDGRKTNGRKKEVLSVTAKMNKASDKRAKTAERVRKHRELLRASIAKHTPHFETSAVTKDNAEARYASLMLTQSALYGLAKDENISKSEYDEAYSMLMTKRSSGFSEAQGNKGSRSQSVGFASDGSTEVTTASASELNKQKKSFFEIASDIADRAICGRADIAKVRAKNMPITEWKPEYDYHVPNGFIGDREVSRSEARTVVLPLMSASHVQTIKLLATLAKDNDAIVDTFDKRVVTSVQPATRLTPNQEAVLLSAHRAYALACDEAVNANNALASLKSDDDVVRFAQRANDAYNMKMYAREALEQTYGFGFTSVLATNGKFGISRVPSATGFTHNGTHAHRTASQFLHDAISHLCAQVPFDHYKTAEELKPVAVKPVAVKPVNADSDIVASRRKALITAKEMIYSAELSLLVYPNDAEVALASASIKRTATMTASERKQLAVSAAIEAKHNALAFAQRYEREARIELAEALTGIVVAKPEAGTAEAANLTADILARVA